MKLSRRQKRILKRKLKRIAGDAVAVIVGAGMFVGLLIAWANEPMPDWSEYIEENHIGMVQVEGSDTWLTQEEYEQMCKERDAYKAAEQAEEQSYYNAILQSTETPVPTTTAAIGSLDWDADDSYRLAKIAMAEAEGEDTEGKALVILVVLNRVWSDDFPDTIEGVITEDTQFAAYENGRYDRVEPDAGRGSKHGQYNNVARNLLRGKGRRDIWRRRHSRICSNDCRYFTQRITEG